MSYEQPVTEIIRKRYSCRTYVDTPIEEGLRRALEEFIAARPAGPLGTPVRFELVTATEEDRQALKGLGTYGVIKGATGFLIGAIQESEMTPETRGLEDFGYLVEEIVLFATSIDLGTCWLGGNFTQSSFAAKMAVREGERIPAVVSVGYISEKRHLVDRFITSSADVGPGKRFPWEHLFFEGQFGTPLSPEAAGVYAESLEMVRLGPSATNKQPWRVVRDGARWHLYLQRTPGYGQGRLTRRFIASDLQRIDMGIAMCHWALTAHELGLAGKWVVQDPGLQVPDDLTGYVVSWVEG